jgi:hypothetical protein
MSNEKHTCLHCGKPLPEDLPRRMKYHQERCAYEAGLESSRKWMYVQKSDKPIFKSSYASMIRHYLQGR